MVTGLIIGGQELILIVVVGIGILFGATRIPLFMRGLGQGIKEFKTSVKDDAPDTSLAGTSQPPVSGSAPPATSPTDSGEPRNAG